MIKLGLLLFLSLTFAYGQQGVFPPAASSSSSFGSSQVVPGANFTNLRVNADRHDASSFVNIVVLGDSHAECAGVASGPLCWTEVLANYLSSTGLVRRGPGFIPMHRNTAVNTGTGAKVNYAWTLAGTGWPTGSTPNAPVSAPSIGFQNLSQGYQKYDEYVNANSATAALGPIPNVDTFCIYFSLSTDTTAGFQYKVDSGSNATVTGSNATAGQDTIQAPVCVSAGALGSHTLTLTMPASGKAHIFGAEGYNSTYATAGGFVIHNLAYSGSDTAFVGATASTAGCVTCEMAEVTELNANSAIDFVINEYGGENDWQQSPEYNLATYKTYQQNIVSYFQSFTTPPGILFLGQCNDQNATNNPNGFGMQTDYQSVFKSVASASLSGVSFLSVADLFGSWTYANGIGLMTDHTHPTAKGYGVMAYAVAGWLSDSAPITTNLSSIGAFTGVDCVAQGLYPGTYFDLCLPAFNTQGITNSFRIVSPNITTSARIFPNNSNGYGMGWNLTDNNGSFAKEDATRNSWLMLPSTNTTAGLALINFDFMPTANSTFVVATQINEQGISAIHLQGINGSAPAVAVGAQAGTGASVAFSGTSTNNSDISGDVAVTAGTSPTAGTVATITFGVQYTTTPHCIAAQVGGSTFLGVGWTDSVGQLALSTAVAIPAGTTKITYTCIR